MDKRWIIQKAEELVKQELGGDVTGHDWFHCDRVRKTALYIQQKENAGDRFLIELAALLHDIADDKLKANGENTLMDFLKESGLDQAAAEQLLSIISTVSYKGGNNKPPDSIEGSIVQDADRLDAIGAIGIARVFAYGGKKGQPIYDPDISVRLDMTEQEYRHGKSSSIHHFYEKLLLLKDKMNTNAAKEMAEKRHQRMDMYLQEFLEEWNGPNENADA